MLINEVQHIVGLSKKSIRYYEENGLLNPKRDINDYRIYSTDDIKKLKLIKFLRELNVSINDIKKLQNKELSLKECMEERIEKIDEENEKFLKIKNMCFDISNNNDTYFDIDIEKYSEEMNILRKQGFTMKDVVSKKKNKIIGALLSGTIFIMFFIFLGSILVYFQITEEEKCPMILFIFFIVMLIIPIIATIYNLYERIKEILKGEEDEACKY